MNHTQRIVSQNVNLRVGNRLARCDEGFDKFAYTTKKVSGSKRSLNNIPTVTHKKRAQSKHRLSTISAPSHTALFHPLLNDQFASRFNRATTDGTTCRPKFTITHAPSIVKQKKDRPTYRFRQLLPTRKQKTNIM